MLAWIGTNAVALVALVLSIVATVRQRHRVIVSARGTLVSIEMPPDDAPTSVAHAMVELTVSNVGRPISITGLRLEPDPVLPSDRDGMLLLNVPRHTHAHPYMGELFERRISLGGLPARVEDGDTLRIIALPLIQERSEIPPDGRLDARAVVTLSNGQRKRSKLVTNLRVAVPIDAETA
ncbi:hypothetical protein GXP71_08150 [Cellulomonas sp. H30R-01]|uniref:hypothetical protein n=1 Tax=Cellulomonas sp. H30R-01 TaxID=2704467 RepID=UPI00138BC744|nr:hypothetical protein [Cellulomonas sp. H30R-01]QHT56053.1 hypothetical protein GXP71_08150 [Cellulomonas sp. H30R-01]